MAGLVLTEEEYTFIVGLEKDLLERAKAASPRAATHLRAAAKVHSDFLAREEGKRAIVQKRTTSKQARDAQKLQRQQERLAALQKKMQEQQAKPADQGAQSQNAAGRERSKANA
ncbi:MAG TPA: hypothetical protein VGN34_12765 [Ktedonobacteraceae bacterium]